LSERGRVPRSYRRARLRPSYAPASVIDGQQADNKSLDPTAPFGRGGSAQPFGGDLKEAVKNEALRLKAPGVNQKRATRTGKTGCSAATA
jgi:hypothetical protein